MYVETHEILLWNLQAETLGNWTEYVSSLKLMLPYFAATSHRTKCWFVIQLHTKSVIKGHVVVDRSSRPYACHIAGVSIELFIKRRFNTPNRFQSNELSHPATISANHGFPAKEDDHGGLPDS